jgi:hypothetical protein
LLALAACKIYGDPPAPLAHYEIRKHPAGWDKDPEVKVAYVEACATDFHRDAKGQRRQPQVAQARVTDGDTTLAEATKATTDTAKADLIIRGIQHYADALRADPYDAQATLKLALAYDKVLHKGCAIAMLRRLESLTQNPKLAGDASHRIDDVVDNTQWFKGYRKEALEAVNH